MTRRRTTEAGYVTAETAVVLPALVLVLLLAVGLVVAVGDELRCVDAAREAVRQAARGETDATAGAAGKSLAPPGSTVVLVHRDGWVQAVVRTRLQPWHLLPAVPLGASARAQEETP